LAIYFGFQSRIYPELTYLTNPVTTTVVDINQASRLKVLFDGKGINSDIRTAQVEIWNDGSRSIKDVDILQPISIKLSPGAPILEAKLNNTTRDVTQMRVDTNGGVNGSVRLNWKILEKGDAGTIQLIYASNEDQRIEVSGIIEGQHDVHETLYRDETKSSKSPGWTLLGSGILYTVMFVFDLKRFNRRRGISGDKKFTYEEPSPSAAERTKRRTRFMTFFHWALLIMGIFSLAAGALFFVLSRGPNLPIAF
jgi:hypothetical protein